jgi:hypothetical protein
MPIKVDIRTEFPRVYGRAVYRRSEFGLTYDTSAVTPDVDRKNLSRTIDQQFGIASGNVFVTAEALTLVFCERDGRMSILNGSHIIRTNPSGHILAIDSNQLREGVR